MIELKNIAKTFGARLIFKEVTATFQAGSVSLLTGENGAGKSTLLRIIAGLSRATAGKVVQSPENASIGLLGHQTFLYPSLTAEENLIFWQKAQGLPCDRETIWTMLQHVRLERHAQTRTGVFSRGMMQRLSLARVLLQKPDILLLDEPATGLDASSQELLDEEIIKARERQTCVICVSHNPEKDSRLADCIYEIRQKRLVLKNSSDKKKA